MWPLDEALLGHPAAIAHLEASCCPQDPHGIGTKASVPQQLPVQDEAMQHSGAQLPQPLPASLLPPSADLG